MDNFTTKFDAFMEYQSSLNSRSQQPYWNSTMEKSGQLQQTARNTYHYPNTREVAQHQHPVSHHPYHHGQQQHSSSSYGEDRPTWNSSTMTVRSSARLPVTPLDTNSSKKQFPEVRARGEWSSLVDEEEEEEEEDPDNPQQKKRKGVQRNDSSAVAACLYQPQNSSFAPRW